MSDYQGLGSGSDGRSPGAWRAIRSRVGTRRWVELVAAYKGEKSPADAVKTAVQLAQNHIQQHSKG